MLISQHHKVMNFFGKRMALFIWAFETLADYRSAEFRKTKITRGIDEFLYDSASYPEIIRGISDFLCDSASYRLRQSRRLKMRKVAKEKSQAVARVVAAEMNAHFQLPASWRMAKKVAMHGR